ncbi:DUF6596 domain-containing protein [Mucilaginibacter yixingensis]|nr:DUF6596 domain-containing protein [Mucilaginibacter yixingensis]
MYQPEITPHLFRTEYSKIVAVLCKTFNLKHIETAEDIAADTFLKASETWALKGVPENPTAWLYTVAKNKVRDHFKHLAVFDDKVRGEIDFDEQVINPEFEFSNEVIADSQLAMIFAVCNPVNAAEAQICMALQILCGFSVKEIAGAFLAKSETIKKRLQRAREVLRNDHFQIKAPTQTEVTLRLDNVLTTLYLLFNEGYFSKTADELIRKDLCAEAMRLLLVLVENPLTNTSQTQALMALMCFQSSRMDARINSENEAVLLDEQDQNAWDEQLMARGNYHLINAFESNDISRYHLEAAIAYWHTNPTAKNRWENILQLYDHLLLIAFSPAAALNRLYAFAKVHGNEMAIVESGQLDLPYDQHYHSLMGYLCGPVAIEQAISHYQQAMELSASITEKNVLAKTIAELRTAHF